MLLPYIWLYKFNVMKYLIILITVLSLTLFSCKKEEIRPNNTNTTLDHNSKKGDSSNTNSSDCNDDNGSITDPNNDEDESKKIKKEK